MAIYVLDITGTNPANRVVNEVRDTITEGQRIFVPTAGSFFVKGFEIRNSATGQLLQPGIQYITLEMATDLVKQIGKNVCSVVYVKDMNIKSVTLTYQAVGGDYQYTASKIQSLLSEYLDGSTNSDVVGSLVATPTQLPPTAHLHLGKTIYGFNEVYVMLSQIRDALLQGDSGMYEHLYQFIDKSVSESETRMNVLIDETNERTSQLGTQSEIGIGRFIFTDDPRNPNIYLGYGEWVLNPNVFLYGANLDEQVGDLIYIDSGSGVIGRKTYIWQRVVSTGAYSYSLTSSAGAVNEGDTITFTLQTTGFTAGTSIPYTISGVSAADIVGGQLKGTFIIGAGGIGTKQIQIAEDYLTEGTETLTIRLTNQPSVLTNVQIRDTSLSPKISLKWSANLNGSGSISSANEGSKIYLIITGENVPAGTKFLIDYVGSTVGANDFNGERRTTYDMDGPAFWPIDYDIKNDFLTEGNEVFVANVTVAPDQGINIAKATATITITDTSLTSAYTGIFTPTSSSTTSITQCSEGDTVYFKFRWTNVPANKNAVLFIGGANINTDDFVGNTYGTLNEQKFVMTAGDGSKTWTIPINADAKTEGDETLEVTVGGDVALDGLAGDVVFNKTRIKIIDTSINPTYNLKFSSNASGTDTINSANEGSNVYAYLKTTNIPNGTVLNITWGGTTNAADFTNTRPATATVQNNVATVPINIKADVITEGSETVVASFFRDGVAIATGTLTVNDTSVAPIYNLKFSANSSGTGEIGSLNEGSTGYIVVTTQNVANNTKLYLTASTGTGLVNTDDFTAAVATEVTITNGLGIVPFTLKNDLTTEGSEIYRINLRTGSVTGTIITSKDLTVNDTSVPQYSAYFSATNTLSGAALTQCNEGDAVWLIIKTTGVPSGTQLTLTYNLPNTEFASNPAATVTIDSNGAATLLISPKNDYTTDGDKSLLVGVVRSGTQITTGSIVIKDTSKTLTITTRWSGSANGSGTISQINEGQTAYLVVTTTNLPNGTVLHHSYSGLQAADFDTAPAATYTVTNNTVTIPYAIKNDVLYEGIEKLKVTIQVKDGSTVVGTVDSAELTVNDTSQPAIGLNFYAADKSTVVTSMDEGQTYYVGVDMRQFAAGTNYTLVMSGTGATDSDYHTAGVADIIYPVVSPSGWAKQSITSNIQMFPIRPIADEVTDGLKTLKIDLIIANETRATKSITINDTSKSASMDIYLSSNANGTDRISAVNEGGKVYLIFKYSNAPSNVFFTISAHDSKYVNTNIQSNSSARPNFEGIYDWNLNAPRIWSLPKNHFTGTVAVQNSWYGTANPFEKIFLESGENKTKAIELQTLADYMDMGDYTWTLWVTMSNATTSTSINYTTLELTVRDTSKPTVSISSWNSAGLRINEGQTLEVTGKVTAGSLPSLFAKRVSGTATANDITIPAVGVYSNIQRSAITLTGAIKLWEADVSFTISTAADFTTEGDEVVDLVFFTGAHPGDPVFVPDIFKPVSAFDDNGKTTVTGGINTYPAKALFDQMTAHKVKLERTLTITDTSATPGYDAFFALSSTAAKSAAISTVNEGVTFYYIVTTTNLPNGTQLTLAYPSGSGVTDTADFTGTMPTTITVTNNRAVATLVTKADLANEGDETLRITVKNTSVSNTNVITSNITVKDSSVPIYDIWFGSAAYAATKVTQINEGQTVYINVSTIGVANNTTLYIRYTNSGSGLTNADMNVPWPTSVVIQNGNASVALTALDDFLAEGDENITMQLATANNDTSKVGPTATLVVKDTSSTQYTIEAVNTVSEGETFFVKFKQVGNSPANKTLYVRYSIPNHNATQLATEFDSVLPDTVTLDQEIDAISATKNIMITVKADLVTDGNKVFNIELSDTSNFAAIRATKSITINDTSKKPSIQGIAYARNMQDQNSLVDFVITDHSSMTADNIPVNINDPFGGILAYTRRAGWVPYLRQVIEGYGFTDPKESFDVNTGAPIEEWADTYAHISEGKYEYEYPRPKPKLFLTLEVHGLANGDEVYLNSTQNPVSGAWYVDWSTAGNPFLVSELPIWEEPYRYKIWGAANWTTVNRNKVYGVNSSGVGKVDLLLSIEDTTAAPAFNYNNFVSFTNSLPLKYKKFIPGGSKEEALGSVPITFRRAGYTRAWGTKSDVNEVWLNPNQWIDIVITGGGGGGGGSTYMGTANVGNGTKGGDTYAIARCQPRGGGKLIGTLMDYPGLPEGDNLIAIAHGGGGGTAGNVSGLGAYGSITIGGNGRYLNMGGSDWLARLVVYYQYTTTYAMVYPSYANNNAPMYQTATAYGGADTWLGSTGRKEDNEQSAYDQHQIEFTTLVTDSNGAPEYVAITGKVKVLGKGGGGGDIRGTNQTGYGGSGGNGGVVRVHLRYFTRDKIVAGPIRIVFTRGSGGIGGRAGGYGLDETTANTDFAERSGKNGERGGSYIANGGVCVMPDGRGFANGIIGR